MPPLPHRTLIVKSQIWPDYIWDLIRDTRRRQDLIKLQECDYSRIMSAILPLYFYGQPHNWIITPEFNFAEANYPDYTMFLVTTDGAGNTVFLPKVVTEIKSKTGQSWGELLEQMWSQANGAKDSNGRIWAIGQKGMEFCVFRFDVLRFGDQIPHYCTHYEPLNLANLSEAQLIDLGVTFEYASTDGGPNRLGIIKWKFNFPEHEVYIHNMLDHIRNNRP